MNASESATPKGRLTTVASSALVGLAMVGYLVGLSDGVPRPDGFDDAMPIAVGENAGDDRAGNEPVEVGDNRAVAAVDYAEIPRAEMGPNGSFYTRTVSLPVDSDYNPFVMIKPSESEKLQSARVRASRRAYNGAPPIIPHAVENTNDAACYACHSGGMKMAGMKASVMSHPYLANCTQCHAPPPPKPFADVESSTANDFQGLPAPTAGKRAFAGAPPTIPHSQWMRENCNACHGGPHGWAGMESTHPWRTNCTQCHAPSAVLDQAVPADSVPMLPPLEVAAK